MKENNKKLDLSDDSAISSVLEQLGAVDHKVRNMLDQAIAEMGHINLIIAGKTGVGKSTLINSVFRQNVASTGVGKPVTDKINVYEKKGIPLRIFDTKGLELDAKAQDDTIKGINDLIHRQRRPGDVREYIHCIWYCFNAGSTKVEDFELNFIRKLSYDVPVIAVVTRGSREKNKQRRLDAEAMKGVIDNELSSTSQYKGCYIVLAKSEDREKPFGLGELVKATAHVIPEEAQKAFINAQKILIEQKVRASNVIINRYTVTAAAVGAIPIPFSDAPLLASAELAMCVHITTTFGIDLDKAIIANLVASLVSVTGLTVVGKLIVSNLFKLVPGAGSVAGGVISGSTAAILMEALGRTYVAILKMIAEGEKQEDDLKGESFKKEMQKMMKKAMKDVISGFKKNKKSMLESDPSQTGVFSDKSREALQDLADLS